MHHMALCLARLAMYCLARRRHARHCYGDCVEMGWVDPLGSPHRHCLHWGPDLQAEKTGMRMGGNSMTYRQCIWEKNMASMAGAPHYIANHGAQTPQS